MLVKELRDIVSKYDSSEKDKIIVELTKEFPRKQKKNMLLMNL